MESLTERCGDAAAIIDAVRRHTEPRIMQAQGGPEFIVLPDGLTAESLKRFEDERRGAPERRKGVAVMTTLQSFCDHVKRFADEHSAVFAVDDPQAPQLIAVLDYHEQGAGGAPRFGEHRSVYRFPVSDEWKAWSAIGGQSIDQVQLAAHLEDHLDDVLDPAAVGESIKAFVAHHGVRLATPLRLKELSRGLSLKVDRRVVSVQNPSTGEARLSFEEAHTDDNGGDLAIPDGFALAIPVFRGGDLYQVPARLRYRVSRGSVSFSVALHRTDRVFEDAFEGALRLVEEATELPVYQGRPE